MLNLAVKFTTNMELKVISRPNFFEGELELIHRLFENGMPCFHLRKPDVSVKLLDEFIQQIDSVYYGQIAVHDHMQLAERYSLKGIHFTFRTKQLMHAEYPNLVKSCSCHSLAELNEVSSVVDEVLLSPIYESISKDGYIANYNLTELENALHKKSNCQVFALGGVTENKIDELQKLGFNGVAVLGSLWQNSNPVDALKKLQNKLL